MGLWWFQGPHCSGGSFALTSSALSIAHSGHGLVLTVGPPPPEGRTKAGPGAGTMLCAVVMMPCPSDT